MPQTLSREVLERFLSDEELAELDEKYQQNLRPRTSSVRDYIERPISQEGRQALQVFLSNPDKSFAQVAQENFPEEHLGTIRGRAERALFKIVLNAYPQILKELGFDITALTQE